MILAILLLAGSVLVAAWIVASAINRLTNQVKDAEKTLKAGLLIDESPLLRRLSDVLEKLRNAAAAK